MRVYLSLLLLAAIPVIHCKSPAAADSPCFQGVLKIKGPCGQRVVSVLNNPLKAVKTVDSWKDESAQAEIAEAFNVANMCDFPENLNVNDTFSFRLTKGSGKECITCFAYIPLPEATNTIEVGCPR